ncbi:MAG: hypothetical protein ACYC61_24055 [Isosphaeraceae bacterium]
MSVTAIPSSTASIHDDAAHDFSRHQHNEVVEINLLLPSHWADELFALSSQRQQSVGQLLRSMIGQALDQGAAQG